MTSRDYAIPDITSSTFAPPPLSATSTFAPAAPVVPPKPLCFSPGVFAAHDETRHTPPPHPRAVYAEGLTLQGFSGASHYGVPSNMELLWKDELNLPEFPRQHLTTIEKLGEGQFGEVGTTDLKNLGKILFFYQ